MIRFDTKKDYDKYFEDIQKIIDLEKENQKLQTEKEQINSLVNSCQEEIRRLKKQLEEINKMIEKCGFVNIEQVMLNYCGLLTQQKEFISYLENEIYSIEPKGTGINYNCEYDSEEDYINAMEEQSKLNTFKEILSKYKKK